MDPQFSRHLVPRTLAKLALLLVATLLIHPDRASAEDCGGPLSSSTGNVVGSVLGAVGGGLLGSQFGGGSGKGVLTGVGVVGGALAGGYAGRSAEGCPRGRPQAAVQPARTCRYVNTEAVINGQSQPVVGIACLGPDGSWQTASGPAAEQAAGQDLVLRAQHRLHDQGFYVRDNIDGRWGPATSNAVRNFQRANSLASTGQLDTPTQTALGIAAVPLTSLAQNAAPAPANQPTEASVPAPAEAPPAAVTPAATTGSSYYK